MKKIVKIGIDFGTSYSFIGFKHGDVVMPLISSRENYGIPSVFYYDGRQKLVGRQAHNQAEKKPEFGVRSVKRKLDEKSFVLAGKTFTPDDVVYEILASIVQGAEQQLELYMVDYDEMEAIITVPIEFRETLKYRIRKAAERITIKNGTKLRVTGVIPEPIAAAIEYFGVKNETDSTILVYDLGGGTFDAAIVRANEEGERIPYRIIEQGGDKKLGGDDWDKVVADWLKKEYIKQTNGEVTQQVEKILLSEARQIKEELTTMQEFDYQVVVKNVIFDVHITRDEFNKMTRHLLERSLKIVRELVQKSTFSINHVVLTGGSSYMPQVKEALENEGIFSNETDIRLVEPERAIAHGAARYAATVEWSEELNEMDANQNPLIKLKATHSYGIRYRNNDDQEIIIFLVNKGEELPAQGSTVSYTRFENQKVSNFVVFESSSETAKNEEVIDKSRFGDIVMELQISRISNAIPKGTESTEILTLTEEGVLHAKAVDHLEGHIVENEINVNRL